MELRIIPEEIKRDYIQKLRQLGLLEDQFVPDRVLAEKSYDCFHTYVKNTARNLYEIYIESRGDWTKERRTLTAYFGKAAGDRGADDLVRGVICHTAYEKQWIPSIQKLGYQDSDLIWGTGSYYKRMQKRRAELKKREYMRHRDLLKDKDAVRLSKASGDALNLNAAKPFNSDPVVRTNPFLQNAIDKLETDVSTSFVNRHTVYDGIQLILNQSSTYPKDLVSIIRLANKQMVESPYSFDLGSTYSRQFGDDIVKRNIQLINQSGIFSHSQMLISCQCIQVAPLLVLRGLVNNFGLNAVVDADDYGGTAQLSRIGRGDLDFDIVVTATSPLYFMAADYELLRNYATVFATHQESQYLFTRKGTQINSKSVTTITERSTGRLHQQLHPKTTGYVMASSWDQMIDTYNNLERGDAVVMYSPPGDFLKRTDKLRTEVMGSTSYPIIVLCSYKWLKHPTYLKAFLDSFCILWQQMLFPGCNLASMVHSLAHEDPMFIDRYVALNRK